jgi:hypothetical protein
MCAVGSHCRSPLLQAMPLPKKELKRIIDSDLIPSTKEPTTAQ